MADRDRLRSAHSRRASRRRARLCRSGIRSATIRTSLTRASASSRFPIWDLAFASTEGREPINPRPRQYATIFRATQNETAGFIAYSEGCNDDVNKFVWNALGWDQRRVGDRERFASTVASFSASAIPIPSRRDLLALERNWEGSILTNASIETTLQQFQDMERSCEPA